MGVIIYHYLFLFSLTLYICYDENEQTVDICFCISRHVEDLECGFLVLTTKEKSKCVSLDNILKHSHLKELCVDRHDSDDDVELLVSRMRHLSNTK